MLTQDGVLRLDRASNFELGERDTDAEFLCLVASQPLCVLDSSGCFVRLNPAWGGRLGHRPDVMVGREVAGFMHADDTARFEAARGAARSRSTTVDARFRCADGGYRRLHWTLVPRSLGGLYGVIELDASEHGLPGSGAQPEVDLVRIVELLSDPTFAIDCEGRIIVWNSAMERLSGIEAKAAIGRTDPVYAIPFYGKMRPILLNMLDESDEVLLAAYPNAIRMGETLVAEVVRRTGNGGSTHYRARAQPLRDRLDQVVGAIECVRDMTNERRTERALGSRLTYEEALARCSEQLMTAYDADALRCTLEQLRAVSGASHAFLFENECDASGPLRARLVSEAIGAEGESDRREGVVRTLDYGGLEQWRRELAEGRPIFGTAEYRRASAAILGCEARSLVVLPVHSAAQWYGFVGFADTRESRLWVAEDLNLLATAANVIGSSIERRRAKEQLMQYQTRLRDLASALALTEERERRRIAAGLHDRINQNLVAITLKLQALRLGRDDADGALGQVLELVETTCAEARSLGFELCPPMLYDLGLQAALSWLVEQMRIRWKLACSLEQQGHPWPLDEDLLGFLYHAVRELLTNVVTHAQAKSARVRVRWRQDAIVLEVTDDGCGISDHARAQATRSPAGFGLLSIRERVRHFQGQLEVGPRSGGGTMVTLLVPLGAPPDEE